MFVTLLAHLHRSAGVAALSLLAALIVMAGEMVLTALGGYWLPILVKVKDTLFMFAKIGYFWLKFKSFLVSKVMLIYDIEGSKCV